MLILIIGDFYIPFKSSDIPQIFRDQLQPGRVNHILCTGNLCLKAELDYLRTICPEITIVKGELDEPGISNSEEEVLTIGGLKIGLISSYSIFPLTDNSKLALKQRELDVNILVHGGSHKATGYVYEGCLYLDPGSATGVPSDITKDSVPSFIILNVQGTTATAYLYHLSNDKIELEKVKYELNP